MISGRELIECIQTMTENERAKSRELIFPRSAGADELGEACLVSGLQANQVFFAKMTPKERAHVEKACLLGP